MATIRLHLPHRARRSAPLPPCHIEACPDCRVAGRRWATVRADWHADQARARSRRMTARALLLLAVLAAATYLIGVLG